MVRLRGGRPNLVRVRVRVRVRVKDRDRVRVMVSARGLKKHLG